MRSDFMQRMAEELAARGIRVVRFEFPYMQAKSAGGRAGAPDRAPVLLQTWKDVLRQVSGTRLVIGGKSMGGRIASMIADDVSAAGLVCLGYPFHPPKQPEKLRTAHLANLRTPTLIVQGTRDTFGTRDEVGAYTLSAQIELLWIEDGDHSLVPRKRGGHDPERAQSEAIAAVAEFVLGASERRAAPVPTR